MMIGKTNACKAGTDIIEYDPSLSTVDITGGASPLSTSIEINVGAEILPNGSTTKFLIPNNAELNIEIKNSTFSFNYAAGQSTRYYCQISSSTVINSVIESLKANGLNLPDGKYKIKLYASSTPNPTSMHILGANDTFNVKVENGVWSQLGPADVGSMQTLMLPSNSLLSSAYLIPLFITKFEI